MSKKSLEDSYRMCFWSMVMIIILLVLLMLTGCKSIEYVPVIEHHTDTLIQTKVVHDSIHVKDSTHVSEKKNGDTVLIEREKWHTKFVYRDVHDTLYVSKTDSVPQPYPVIKEVPRPLTKTQIVLMIVGFVCTALVVIYIGKKIHALLP